MTVINYINWFKTRQITFFILLIKLIAPSRGFFNVEESKIFELMGGI